MNWKRNYFYLLFTAIILIGCDSFQEDLAPVGEQELELTDAISVLPNTPLFIDLKKTLQTASTVKFEIVSAPKLGDVSILEQAILHYKPHDTFNQGTDVFSLSITSESGQLIDIDSIVISMENSTDSLPCFNGALSDYYVMGETDPLFTDQSILIYPIINDGYCVDNTSGAILDFIEEPQHGVLEQVELFTYEYTPDLSYYGLDVFKYELTLIDNDGNEFYSLAEVVIEILDNSTGGGSCDSLVYPFVVYMTDSLESIEIFPFMPGAACDVFDWNITINSVSSGTAQVSSDNLIEYFPEVTMSDSVASIIYTIELLDLNVQNEITVILHSDDGGSESCVLMANDDNYDLFIDADSIPGEDRVYYLDLTDNDETCNSDFDVTLITTPSIGEAVIDQYDNVEYTVNEAFEGVKETSFIYQLCNNGICDSAFVNLRIEQ